MPSCVEQKKKNSTSHVSKIPVRDAFSLINAASPGLEPLLLPSVLWGFHLHVFLCLPLSSVAFRAKSALANPLNRPPAFFKFLPWELH
jgi:hypothetical protein